MTSTETATDDADVSVREAELGKRERNKLDKRRRIVAAATQLFQEKGFEDTTTAEIAAQAGIGAGTLYLYVGSKEDLLALVFEKVAGDTWAEAFERADRTRPLIEQLREMFTFVTEHHEADARLAKSFFKELPWVDEPARTIVAEMMQRFYSGLRHVLDEAIDSGRLDPGVNTVQLGFNLFTLWMGHMRRIFSDRIDGDAAREEMDEIVRVALWGMTPDT